MTGKEPQIFLNGRVALYCGDSRDVLRELESNSIDSVVCDPPYALVSIQKRFGKPGSAAVKVPADGTGAYARASAGFMGKQWDTGETAFAAEFWAEVLRVLKPGGYVVAFSGTRTYHRMACAIEDAGFEIRDQLAWAYGSGFPKSHDVSKAIDKMDAAVERRRRNISFTAWLRSTGITAAKINEVTNSFMGSHYLTDREQAAVPTEDMFAFLRPLLPAPPEFIEALVAERTVESENFKARGVTGTSNKPRPTYTTGNIGGDAAANGFQITSAFTDEAREWQGWGTALKPAWEPICLARKPLIGTVAENVLEHGTGALNIDGCRVGFTGEADRTSAKPGGKMTAKAGALAGGVQNNNTRTEFVSDNTKGRWPANIIHDGSDEVLAAFPGQAGAASPVRGTEASLASAGTITGARARVPGEFYSDSGSAARFFYTAKADADDRLGSKHPTVKPLDLMQYLVRLVTPPGGTVLDPFAGTGTTGEAAWREGFKAVLIEREPEYQDDIARRMDLAAKPLKRAAVAKTKNKLMGAEGTPLFGGKVAS